MTAKNNITKPHDAFTKANLADIDRIKALTKSHYSKAIVSLIKFDTFENKPTEFILLITALMEPAHHSLNGATC